MAAIPGSCGRERGLTLVEMLVVLAIIAVMAGATSLAIGRGGNGGDRALEAEATRLATRLRLAADDVRLDERPLAFVWDEHGYAFLDWDAAHRKWMPDGLSGLARRELPGRIGFTIAGQRTPAPITGDGTGPPISARMVAGGVTWEVRFDGLDARAARIAG